MKPSVVFFGTGPVSLNCLEGIADAVELEAIVTKPDRIAPDGTTHTHPVKDWATTRHIPVIQVANRHQLETVAQQKQWHSQVGLVVDFGLIIPETVIASFPLGILNSHFSLLPELRGADPITFAILEGKKHTGVSLMQIVPALDEGPLLKQVTYTMPTAVTTPELTKALCTLSNELICSCLPDYIAGRLMPNPQVETGVSYTRKLTKTDGIIDWSKPAVQLEREVRAYLGWPGSRTQLFGKDVIITAGSVAPNDAKSNQPGTAAIVGDEIYVATGKDTLAIRRLKPAGKREMAAAEFIRGLR